MSHENYILVWITKCKWWIILLWTVTNNLWVAFKFPGKQSLNLQHISKHSQSYRENKKGQNAINRKKRNVLLRIEWKEQGQSTPNISLNFSPQYFFTLFFFFANSYSLWHRHLFMVIICAIVESFYKINKFWKLPKFLKYLILLIHAWSHPKWYQFNIKCN